MKQHFIDSRWTSGATGETLPVVDPSTGEVIDAIVRGNVPDIDAAVRRQAQRSRPREGFRRARGIQRAEDRRAIPRRVI